MKGRIIGTVTGFTIVPEMKKVPGTTEVKLYDNCDGCMRDVVAGRLDFAVLDAPLVDYMILQEPGLEPEAGADGHDAGVPAAHQQAAHRDGHEPGQSRPVRRGERRREMAVEDQAERRADGASTASATRIIWCRRRRTRASASTATPTTTPIGPGAHTAKDFSSLFA